MGIPHAIVLSVIAISIASCAISDKIVKTNANARIAIECVKSGGQWIVPGWWKSKECVQ